MRLRFAIVALLLLVSTAALAATADIELVRSGNDGPTPVREGEVMNFYFAMRNNGPDVAGDVTVTLGPYVNVVNVDLYANASPDGDGERWIQAGGVHQNGSFAIELRADLRGLWINATSTRTHWIAAKPPADAIVSHAFAGGQSMTSELSNAVPVE